MKKNKSRFRFDIVIACSLFVLLVSFCAYMLNTSLEEVLEKESGQQVITHNYNTENNSENK
ncbi:MAG: hypothetical protein ACI4I6_09175 [Hominimerdicola sp.]